MVIHHPDYSHLPCKLLARAENVAHFRKTTGRSRLTRQYWTLCNRQPNEEGSEIVQLVNMGLLSKPQFNGVDWDSAIIAENRVCHPTAHWYSGDWNDVILQEDFDPELVYLDTTNFASKFHAVNIVTHTLQLCKNDCMIFANLMLSNPHNGERFNPKEFIENLSRSLPPGVMNGLVQDVEMFTYNATGDTDMITYVIRKK